MYVTTSFLCNAHGGLDLELQTIMSCHVGTGYKPLPLPDKQMILNPEHLSCL